MTKGLQFQFRQQRYKLRFRPGFFCVCLFIICSCYMLGIWQLHRYHFKKNLLDTYQQRVAANPIPFASLNLQNAQFTRVAVSGEYENDLMMIVQNRPHDEQMGFEILTPLKIAGEKKLLLVDRGWIDGKGTQQFPQINSLQGFQQITGDIKLQNEYQFILGQNIPAPDSKPLVMQKIDIAEISRVTHQEFFPFVLRLSPTADNGFVRDWVITTVMPQRHMAYAVQWFAMMFALVIAYLCFCCEKLREQ
jgi:surfeit locus 1 family protein